MAKKYESVTNVQKRDVHLLDSWINNYVFEKGEEINNGAQLLNLKKCLISQLFFSCGLKLNKNHTYDYNKILDKDL